MTSRTKLWALSAGALALSLALAGCGGGGSSSSSLAGATGGSGGVPATEETPMDESTPPTSGDVFVAVNAAEERADDAVDSAKAAAKAAADAALKLGPAMALAVQTGGDSNQATMTAQMVLDGKMDAEAALVEAQAALVDAEDAKADAESIASDDANRAAAIEAADEAIEAVTEQIEAIEAILRTGGDLDLDVKMVTGTGTTPKTAAALGKTIADTVSPRLAATARTGRHSNAATGAAPTLTAAQTAAGESVKAVKADNAKGYTWKELVGDTVKERVGGAKLVDTAVVTGKLATTFGIDDTTNPTYADGASVAANYKGIAGTVHCLGSGCDIDHNDMFVGRWVFKPTSATAHYVRDTAMPGKYAPEKLYVQFGHWLHVNDPDDLAEDPDEGDNELLFRTYAYLAGSEAATTQAEGTTWTLAAPVPGGPAALSASSATYSGTAMGLAVHDVSDADGKTTAHSGAFTADVTLSAFFAASPTLEGKISGFTSANANAVDSNWEVELARTELSAGTFDTGVTRGMRGTSVGTPGVWTAGTYGTDGEKRPDGFFGGFDANFTDGQVAGAYATRK